MASTATKPREYYTVQKLLRLNGYTDIAEIDTYIWSVLDYMDSVPDNDYTIFDWLEDTKANYPEDLVVEDE